MISWASKKLLNASLVVALLATFTTVGFLNSSVSADAITGKNSDGLASQTERWLRLRAVAKCFNDNDIGKNSYNDVEKGAIFDSGGVAIGFLNEDGKVSCDGDGGEAFVRNSFGIIGFSNPVAAFCSVQPMASRGSSDSKNESNFEGCTTGSGDEFDMDSDAFDQGARQVEQFKKGYQEHAQSPVSWSPSPAMMYHVYRSSLIEFCGAERIGVYDPADENNVNADKRKVVVNDIDLSTGEIIQSIYRLDRDQTDKVDDIYVNNDMNNVSNVSCGDMAKKTWDYDEDMKAYVLAYNADNKDDVPESGTIGGGNTGGEGDNEPVCTAGALGWVICPTINFIADMNDAVYDVVENMLYINPVTVETGGALYGTWTKFRDLANVLFVIVFLIVVFSQATSIGLSSYGIKRILPRIFAAAVLVNISFFICQLAIDLSNIIGVGVTDMVGSLQSGATLDINQISWSTAIAAAIGGAGLYAGVTVALAAGGVGAAIAMLLPFAVSALFAVVTALVVLIARQVLIILLVALAPLAFIAIILPNTQKYFQLWQNTFTTLLVMFPLVALLFAGSQLAANIILTSPTSGDGISYFSLIAAVAMMFIPLFGVPYIVKFSGGTLGRIAGLVNNPNKGPFDSLRRKAEGYRDFKTNKAHSSALEGTGRTKNPFTRRVRKNAERDYKYGLHKGIREEAEQEYIANKSLGANGEDFAKKMAGSDNKQYVAAVQASAKATADKLEKQNIANREILIRAKYKPEVLLTEATKELESAMRSNDITAARAAQNILLNAGSKGLVGIGAAHESASSSATPDAMAKLKSDLNGAGLKGKDNALATYAFTNEGLDTIRVKADTYSGLTDAEFVGQSQKNIEAAVAAKAITPERAQKMLESDALRGALDANKRKEIEKLVVSSGSSGQIVIPRGPAVNSGPTTPTQQQRQQGGNFSGGPGQNIPPSQGNGPSNPNPPANP